MSKLVAYCFNILVYICIAFAAILPVFFLILLSFSKGWIWPHIIPNTNQLRAWTYVLSNTSGTMKALSTSVQIACCVVIVNIAIALPAGNAFGRYSFKGKAIYEAILLAPIVIPPVLVMMGMHKTFIKLGLTESITGVILAHMIPTLPYMIRSLTIAYKHLGFDWEEQAKVLGAGKLKRFLYVIFPFLLPGIIAGTSLTILISLSEYAATLLIGGGGVVTLSILMFPFVNGGDQSIGAAYSLLFAAVAILVLIILDLFLKHYYSEKKIFK